MSYSDPAWLVSRAIYTSYGNRKERSKQPVGSLGFCAAILAVIWIGGLVVSAVVAIASFVAALIVAAFPYLIAAIALCAFLGVVRKIAA